MIQTVERTIGEHRYRLTQLPVSRGRPMLVRLTRVLGPVFAELVRAGGGRATLQDATGEALAAAVRELATRLTEEDVDYCCATFAEFTQLHRGGDKWVPLAPEMELHFAGGYDRMLRWVAAHVEVNFASFFAGLGLGARREPAAPAG